MNLLTYSKPLVSVIIPVYNRGSSIKRAAESVLSQTYGDIELIVVDDGSNDNTGEEVEAIEDTRVRYIRLNKNRGAPAARNVGTKAAKGDYIAFQDSDDQWLPQKLEKQMKIFENASENVGAVYTAFYRVENRKKEYIPYSWVKKKEGYIHREVLKGSFITTPSIVVRRECFEKVGMFDERLPRLQDWELVIRLSKYYEFRFIDEPLLVSPYTSDSLTANRSARIEALKLILSKHWDDFLEDKDSLSRYCFSIGVHQCLNNEIEDGENYLRKGFEVKPDRHILAEHYFTIGRRLCSRDIKIGRNYLTKALKLRPLDARIFSVLAISLLGPGVYQRVAQFYKRWNRD